MVSKSIREEFVGKLVTLTGESRFFARSDGPSLIFDLIEKDEVGIIFDAYYDNDGSESVSSTLYVKVLFRKKQIKIPFSSVRIKYEY